MSSSGEASWPLFSPVLAADPTGITICPPFLGVPGAPLVLSPGVKVGVCLSDMCCFCWGKRRRRKESWPEAAGSSRDWRESRERIKKKIEEEKERRWENEVSAPCVHSQGCLWILASPPKEGRGGCRVQVSVLAAGTRIPLWRKETRGNSNLMLPFLQKCKEKKREREKGGEERRKQRRELCRGDDRQWDPPQGTPPFPRFHFLLSPGSSIFTLDSRETQVIGLLKRKALFFLLPSFSFSFTLFSAPSFSLSAAHFQQKVRSGPPKRLS